MRTKTITRWSVLLALALLVCLCVGLTACGGGYEVKSIPGNMITLTADANGVATSSSASAPEDLDFGVKGYAGKFLTEPTVGVDFIHNIVAENAEPFPIHGGDDTVPCLCYVVYGQGELVLADANKTEASRTKFVQGDYILINPGCWHGWDFDGAGELVVCRITPPPAAQ